MAHAIEEWVDYHLRDRSILGLGPWGNSSKDVLRGEKVGMGVGSMRHGELQDSERSLQCNYGWDREGNVAHILRCGRRNC